MEKILPQLSTQLARLVFPYSLSPVTSTGTAAKYILLEEDEEEEGLAEEIVYLSDICGSSSCLRSVPASFKTTFQMAASQTDYTAKPFRRWTHSRASSLNFMHNLSSSKGSKTLKDNLTVRSESCDDLPRQQTDF